LCASLMALRSPIRLIFSARWRPRGFRMNNLKKNLHVISSAHCPYVIVQLRGPCVHARCAFSFAFAGDFSLITKIFRFLQWHCSWAWLWAYCIHAL
jgi:hypothetical protein